MTSPTSSIDLSGPWDFALGDEPDYRDVIQLPGSLQAQGFGHDVAPDTAWTGQIVDRSWFTEERYAPYRQPGNLKIPFWLQSQKHYVGAAWYRREIEIPEEWSGHRIVLTLERAHIQTTVFLDGEKLVRATAWLPRMPLISDVIWRRAHTGWSSAWTTASMWMSAPIPAVSPITRRRIGTGSSAGSS